MPFFLQRVNKENERSLKRGKKVIFNSWMKLPEVDLTEQTFLERIGIFY